VSSRLPATEAPPPPPANHFIVCGLGRFGLRVVELLRAGGRSVVVITDAATRADRKRDAHAFGARIVEGDFRFPDVLQAAGLEQAKSLLLVSSNDGANLETALDARRIAPRLRIVMRLDSDKVAQRLQRDFEIDAVLSPPVLAAAEFARAALDAAPPLAPGAAASGTMGAAGLPRRLRHDGPAAARARRLERPAPALIAVYLLLLFGVAVAVFQNTLGLPLVDAIYFTSTILTTVGFGDYNLQRAPDGVKLFGSVLMFGGVMLIAVLSSFLTNYYLSGAAARLRNDRAIRHLRGHVILCGLGRVGFEVAEDLLARGVRAVVVDATPGDIHWHNLSSRLPLLIGDATRPDLLIRAGIDRARALIAAVSDDAINLEIGLVAQSLVEERRPLRPLRLVLRCFDPELARRIHAVSDAYTLLSSAELAAPLFVQQATAGGN